MREIVKIVAVLVLTCVYTVAGLEKLRSSDAKVRTNVACLLQLKDDIDNIPSLKDIQKKYESVKPKIKENDEIGTDIEREYDDFIGVREITGSEEEELADSILCYVMRGQFELQKINRKITEKWGKQSFLLVGE